MANWPKSYSIRLPLLLLAIAELLGAYISVVGAALLYHGGYQAALAAIPGLKINAGYVSIVMLTCLVAMGLYNFHQRLYFREVLARVIVGVVFGALVLAASYFLFPSVSLPRGVSTIAIVTMVAVVLLIRVYFFHTVDTNVFRRRTLIYGAGERAQAIGDLRRRADRRGFVVVGSIPASGDASVSKTNGKLIRDRSVAELASELEIDEVVIAMDDRRGNLPIRDLLNCRFSGVNVIDIVEFLERESEKVRIDLVNPAWLIFSPGFRVSRLRKISKRLFDTLISASVLLLLWPVMLLVALAIKLEGGLRSSVLYRQTRVGQYGESFEILKFRSMVENAEQASGAVWAEENDPRITRVGRFLRKTRLDELPQLLNILHGDMSLVGPRPERPEFVEELAETIPYYPERHLVKPGLTGWAQLRYSYASSMDDTMQKLQFDLFYVKKQSLILDIVIMLQTIEVVIWGKGAR